MRALAACWTVAILAGCGKGEPKPYADTTAMVPQPAMTAPAAPAMSLAGMAGTWNMTTRAAGSDSVLLSFTMLATADSSGWMFNFPGRAPVPVRVVSVAGDSIVTVAGPYASMLTKGATVTTNSVMRMQGGKLVGTTVAHYNLKGADSVKNLTTEGTRAP